MTYLSSSTRYCVMGNPAVHPHHISHRRSCSGWCMNGVDRTRQRQTERERDREREGDRHRETDRERDRQTDRQTYKERESETYCSRAFPIQGSTYSFPSRAKHILH